MRKNETNLQKEFKDALKISYNRIEKYIQNRLLIKLY
jgi:hypothetical protein